MIHQPPEQQGPRCLLCINRVTVQGDVCPRCEPEYIAIGKVLTEYAGQLEPLLKASPYKRLCTAIRFVLDSLFFLEELPAPILYKEKSITHRFTVMRVMPPTWPTPLQAEHWYGHNIPSALMASTLEPGGFPRDPFYFLPIANWKPASCPGATIEHDLGSDGKNNGQH